MSDKRAYPRDEQGVYRARLAIEVGDGIFAAGEGRPVRVAAPLPAASPNYRRGEPGHRYGSEVSEKRYPDRGRNEVLR